MEFWLFCLFSTLLSHCVFKNKMINVCLIFFSRSYSVIEIMGDELLLKATYRENCWNHCTVPSTFFLSFHTKQFQITFTSSFAKPLSVFINCFPCYEAVHKSSVKDDAWMLDISRNNFRTYCYKNKKVLCKVILYVFEAAELRNKPSFSI